jgi:branched-chain amino acid transport system ATP-binding protein
MLLEVKDIEAGYGKNRVLNGVSLSLDKGEIIALLGHNGAGKTTTLKAILGLVRPVKGNTFYHGKDMTQDPPAAKVKEGMVLVLQEKSIFTDLTTMENLEVSSHIIEDRSRIVERIEMVNELFPILEKRAAQRAGTLSGGEQRMLAIGMGLMLEPELFMLDEPSVGLSPLMVQNVIEAIKEINRRLGSAILLVEQNIQEALTAASRAYIMKSGQILMDETSSNLLEMENLWHFL